MQKNKVFIALLLMIASTTIVAQSTTNSPYSKYGIGILRNQAFSQSFGMGSTSLGLRSNRDINIINAASYSAIQATTFDVGYTNNALWLDDGTETQYQNNPYINHIAFAFPMIKDKWGMSFGVLPFSNVGYKYEDVIEDPTAGSVSLFSEGNGAINKVYLGNAVAVKLDSTSLLSFGVNAYFLFGSINHDQKIVFGNLANSFNIWKIQNVSVADFGFDVGLQYQKTFTNTDDDKLKLTLGATYALSSDLNAKNSETILSFDGADQFITSNELQDTSAFTDKVKDIVQLPSEIGFGISLEKENKWILAVDYKTTNWGSIASNDPLFSYQSNYSLAAGAQFIPKHNGTNYLGRVAYRLGTRFSNSYLVINNTDWTEYGITFGLGLPIMKSGASYPRLNFGFEYGKRGTTDSSLIEETFLDFNIGITINAIWFRKRKYD